MKGIVALVVLPLICYVLAPAQVPSDKENLIKGEGMGQGLVAEQNGYPGPKHVLDVAEKLQLTPEQKKSIESIFKEMDSRAKELGLRIIKLEEEMNRAFEEGFIVERSVRDDAEQIGRLRGRLRAVHLIAHLRTKQVLTPKQLESYNSLRSSKKDG